MANEIKIGINSIDSFKVGSVDCKVYLGDVLLYPQSTTLYKLLAKYSDLTEYKVECDGGTALTASEVSGYSTPKSAMTSADIGSCQGFSRIDTNAFYGCSGLTSITIDNSIKYFGNQAFMGCSGLTSFTFPTNLKQIEGSCFRLCNQIRTIDVPSGVTYLSSGCFADMAGLTAATIPATVTGTSTNLFLRDAALNNVHFLGRTAPALGVDAFRNTGIQKIYIPDCDCYDSYAETAGMSAYTGYIYAENSNTKCIVAHYSTQYLSFVAIENGTFKFTSTSGNSIDYSIDSGTTWTTLASGVDSPTITSGSTIMWRGSNMIISITDPYGIGTFSSTGKFDVEGNIMSLIYGDDFINKYSLSGKDYVFMDLFKSCPNVVNTKNMVLPATTLSQNCYRNMFYALNASSSLLTAPVELPATTLADRCYYSMFQGCSGLTSVSSDLLPATTLAIQCYCNMFSRTYALTNVPKLPATTLAVGCYQNMFYSDKTTTAMTTPTAVFLPAATLVQNCYNQMFRQRSGVNRITCLATSGINTNNSTTNWLYSVSSSGTFTRASSSVTWPTGANGRPIGWTLANYA